MSFFAREQELDELRAQLVKSKSASLIYGKRRVGKTSLILEAAKRFEGEFLYYECVRTSVEDNLERLTQQIAAASNNPYLRFRDFTEPLACLGTLGRPSLLVLDEYQNLKALARPGEMDSLLQAAIDSLATGVHVVVSGSYISVMKELIEEDNPLFGRFDYTLNLRELDYLDTSLFAPDLSVREKVSFYAVFGGLPFANSRIDFEAPLARNVQELILKSNGSLRVYLEYVLFAELSKAGATNRILAALGNGRKRYNEIERAAKLPQNGSTDKVLKTLVDMQAVKKTHPINRPNDTKKTFYEIADNLLRFYYSFVFGNERYIEVQGAQSFYDDFVEPKLSQYTARRFEDIAAEYFVRRSRSMPAEQIVDVGRFWYDDAHNKTNAEFDVALKHLSGSYSFIEAKHYAGPMQEGECKQETLQVARIAELTNIGIERCGFVSLEGFDFESSEFELITGEDLYNIVRSRS